MDYKDVLFGRRSVRKYTSEPVSDEDLQYIIDAGLYGPSAVDLQPWYFVVIKSKEAMEKLTGYTGIAKSTVVDRLNRLLEFIRENRDDLV